MCRRTPIALIIDRTAQATIKLEFNGPSRRNPTCPIRSAFERPSPATTARTLQLQQAAQNISSLND